MLCALSDLLKCHTSPCTRVFTWSDHTSGTSQRLGFGAHVGCISIRHQHEPLPHVCGSERGKSRLACARDFRSCERMVSNSACGALPLQSPDHLCTLQQGAGEAEAGGQSRHTGRARASSSVVSPPRRRRATSSWTWWRGRTSEGKAFPSFVRLLRK